MLQKIGLTSIDELFRSIPQETRFKGCLPIDAPMDEQSLLQHLSDLASKNRTLKDYKSYLGAGCYNHYIPTAVNQLLLRSELYTAYTPYQPEISQGTLQAIFEFQTLISLLFEMDVTNASMYDGATAVTEAVLMAKRVNGKNKTLISSLLHPEYKETIFSYIGKEGVKEIKYNESGVTSLEELEAELNEDCSSVIIQYPNFFGSIEDLKAIRKLIDRKAPTALMIVAIAEASSLGLLTPPGRFGADIVAGEGQSLGIPLSFGGPGVGLFSCKSKYLRKMPGRLAGETVDKDGKRGFVFTISTREQHIRRESATSNICSNHSLMAVATAIYLSLMGKNGFKEISLTNFYNTQYAIKMLSQFSQLKVKYGKKVFNEFVIEFDNSIDAQEVYSELLKRNIVFGLPLKKYFSSAKNSILINFTEKTSQKEIDELVKKLVEVIGGLS